MPFPKLREHGRKNWNANPVGADAVAFSARWKNHWDGTQWLPISSTVSDDGSRFSNRALPAEIELPSFSDGSAIISANNRADVIARDLITEPALVATSTPEGVSRVQGRFGSVNRVNYPMAYPGLGAGLQYRIRTRSSPVLEQRMVWRDPNNVPAIDVVVSNLITFDAPVDIQIRSSRERVNLGDRTPWDGSGRLNAGTHGFIVTRRGSTQHRELFVSNFSIFDSSTQHRRTVQMTNGPVIMDFRGPRRRPVETYIERINDQAIRVSKVIPANFFQRPNITYPVFLDPTFDPTSGSGGYDGDITFSDNTTWAQVRDNATGTVDETDVNFFEQSTSDISGGIWIIYRAGLSFDCSGITDGHTIDSAYLNLFAVNGEIKDQDNGGVRIVDFSPASNTALASGDYDGTTFTAHSANIDIGTSITANAYNQLDYNAAGVAALVDGYNTSMLVERNDYDDTDPTNDMENRVRWESEESSGTNEPQIVITTSAGGASAALMAIDTIVLGAISSPTSGILNIDLSPLGAIAAPTCGILAIDLSPLAATATAAAQATAGILDVDVAPLGAIAAPTCGILDIDVAPLVATATSASTVGILDLEVIPLGAISSPTCGILGPEVIPLGSIASPTCGILAPDLIPLGISPEATFVSGVLETWNIPSGGKTFNIPSSGNEWNLQ